ncbi:MAG: type II secretion system minor pseudopilin GspI [Ideonella sp.]|jgi:general secretion pathway protein I|nr:type II secretion system minor pseudopilin GspI [Ideonella sp.]
MTRSGCRPCLRRSAVAAGFTLIEVLVALAIVAITLAAGAKAASALGDNAIRLIDVTAAQWCAENQLAGMKLTRQFPGIGDADFTCSQMGREYQGKLRVRPTPNPNFRRVDAQVFAESGAPILTVSTVLPRF